MGVRGGRSSARLIFRLVLVFIALTLFVRRSGYFTSRQLDPGDPTASVSVEPPSAERAFAERSSGTLVDAAGVVERILEDDLRGSRHQRFILRLDSGLTVLVAHNIDIAPRVPLSVGAAVEVRGDYEWNEKGGVIHWTHRDPDGRRPGGFVRFEGETFR